MTAPFKYPVRFRDGRAYDHALVYSSWMEQERVRFPNTLLPKAEVFGRMRGSIESVLARGRLSIAHDADDTDNIYAYLVWESVPLAWRQVREGSPESATVIYYLYTKGMFRRRGFAAALLRHAIPSLGKAQTYTTAMTHYRQPTLRDDKGEPIGVVEGEQYRQAWHQTAQAHKLIYHPLLIQPRTERRIEAA